ncbi:MAG TPA: sulfite exporter TauE/SafE family protein [Gammaproteobacteria bacterium]|nr:sulfite exporter TauE/SafE family protein [Gammaproteobacteria bacterium]
MDITPLTAAGILGIGFAAGTLGTIVGAGGGFLFVPALLMILHLPPPVAAGTGLLVVLTNALSGITGFIRQHRVSYRISLRLVVGAIPGAFLGVHLAEMVPAGVFYKIFACLLVGLGLFLMIKRSPKSEIGNIDEQSEHAGTDIATFQLLGVGLLMGTVSSYFGIGGGWLLVPILVYAYGVRPHVATATAIFSLCLNSIVGSAIYISHGNVDWTSFIFGAAGIMVGAQIGVYLSTKLSGGRIIQILSLVLVGTGIKLFLTK